MDFLKSLEADLVKKNEATNEVTNLTEKLDSVNLSTKVKFTHGIACIIRRGEYQGFNGVIKEFFPSKVMLRIVDKIETSTKPEDARISNHEPLKYIIRVVRYIENPDTKIKISTRTKTRVESKLSTNTPVVYTKLENVDALNMNSAFGDWEMTSGKFYDVTVPMTKMELLQHETVHVTVFINEQGVYNCGIFYSEEILHAEKIYTVKVLPFEAKSEEELMELLSANVEVAKSKLEITKIKAKPIREFYMNINTGEYGFLLGIIPDVYTANYEKNVIIQSNQITTRPTIEIRRGDLKGYKVVKMIKKIPAYFNVLLDANNKSITSYYGNGSRKYLTSKDIFYMDVKLKNNNNAQVDKIEDGKWYITEDSNKFIERVTDESEVASFLPGFQTNVKFESAEKKEEDQDQLLWGEDTEEMDYEKNPFDNLFQSPGIDQSGADDMEDEANRNFEDEAEPAPQQSYNQMKENYYEMPEMTYNESQISSLINKIEKIVGIPEASIAGKSKERIIKFIDGTCKKIDDTFTTREVKYVTAVIMYNILVSQMVIGQRYDFVWAFKEHEEENDYFGKLINNNYFQKGDIEGNKIKELDSKGKVTKCNIRIVDDTNVVMDVTLIKTFINNTPYRNVEKFKNLVTDVCYLYKIVGKHLNLSSKVLSRPVVEMQTIKPQQSMSLITPLYLLNNTRYNDLGQIVEYPLLSDIKRKVLYTELDALVNNLSFNKKLLNELLNLPKESSNSILQKDDISQLLLRLKDEDGNKSYSIEELNELDDIIKTDIVDNNTIIDNIRERIKELENKIKNYSRPIGDQEIPIIWGPESLILLERYKSAMMKKYNDSENMLYKDIAQNIYRLPYYFNQVDAVTKKYLSSIYSKLLESIKKHKESIPEIVVKPHRTAPKDGYVQRQVLFSELDKLEEDLQFNKILLKELLKLKGTNPRNPSKEDVYELLAEFKDEYEYNEYINNAMKQDVDYNEIYDDVSNKIKDIQNRIKDINIMSEGQGKLSTKEKKELVKIPNLYRVLQKHDKYLPEMTIKVLPKLYSFLETETDITLQLLENLNVKTIVKYTREYIKKHKLNVDRQFFNLDNVLQELFDIDSDQGMFRKIPSYISDYIIKDVDMNMADVDDTPNDDTKDIKEYEFAVNKNAFYKQKRRISDTESDSDDSDSDNNDWLKELENSTMVSDEVIIPNKSIEKTRDERMLEIEQLRSKTKSKSKSRKSKKSTMFKHDKTKTENQAITLLSASLNDINIDETSSSSGPSRLSEHVEKPKRVRRSAPKKKIKVIESTLSSEFVDSDDDY